MKNLLFAALLAIVAVGSAYAQNYQATAESSDPNATKFDCTTLTAPTCGSVALDIYVADTNNLVPYTAGSAYDRHYEE